MKIDASKELNEKEALALAEGYYEIYQYVKKLVFLFLTLGFLTLPFIFVSQYVIRDKMFYDLFVLQVEAWLFMALSLFFVMVKMERITKRLQRVKMKT